MSATFQLTGISTAKPKSGSRDRNTNNLGKMKKTLMGIAVALLTASATVQAIPITGTVRMAGDVTLDTTSLATADAALSFAGVAVAGAPTGSYTGTGGAAVTW